MSAELSPLEAFQRYGALGPDFLTWLLVRILQDDVPKISSDAALKIDIQGPLLFAGEGGEATKVTMAGDEAAAAPEVLSALRQGKKLMRAKLLFDALEDQYVFTMDAETFDLKGIKLPVPALADLAQYFDMRVEALGRLYLYVDDLFEAFLQIRLSPQGWQEEGERWRAMARGK